MNAMKNRLADDFQLRCTGSTARFDGTGCGCYDRTAGWSSLVARWAHNPKVGGSNPPPATKFFSYFGAASRGRSFLFVRELYVLASLDCGNSRRGIRVPMFQPRTVGGKIAPHPASTFMSNLARICSDGSNQTLLG